MRKRRQPPSHQDAGKTQKREVFIYAGLPSRSLWSAEKEVQMISPPSLRYGVAAFAFPLRSKAKAGGEGS
jgi:hypothetical protein